MLFSVVIVAGDDARAAEASVLSAMTQSLENTVYEIVIIDDASAADTVTRLDHLTRRHTNIRFLHNTRRIGLGASKNRALDETAGEYLVFLEAGTLLKSDALEAYSIAIAEKHPDVIYADVMELNEYGEQIAIIGGEWGKFQTQAAVYNKSFLHGHRIRFGDSSLFCDLPFAAACFERAAETCVIPAELLYYLETVPDGFARRQPSKPVSKADWPRLVEAASEAVIFVPLIDGHVRHFTLIARQLLAMGIKCVIFDVTPAVTGKKRQTTDQDRANLSGIPYFAFDRSYSAPIMETARAYIFAGDWGYAYDLIFQCKSRQIPTICLYEGVNNDFKEQEYIFFRGFPYRNMDYLFLPGKYYQKIYTKQKTVVTGLPVLHTLLEEPVIFPSKPTVLVNLNFNTIRDGEPKSAEVFIVTVTAACNEVGIPLVWSLHPSYTGPREGLKPSGNSIYEDLKQCTVLISRFSTCILESLALGKPVIYHNPHGEKIPKFQEDPMGAYAVTTTKEALVTAIKNTLEAVAKKTDFREKSAAFLQHHGNIFTGQSPALSVAAAIKEIIGQDSTRFQKRVLRYADRGLLKRPPSSVPYPSVGSRSVVMAAHAVKKPIMYTENEVQAYLDARSRALRIIAPAEVKAPRPPQPEPQPAYTYKTPGRYWALFWAHQFYRVEAFFTCGHRHRAAVIRRRACADKRKQIKLFLMK